MAKLDFNIHRHRLFLVPWCKFLTWNPPFWRHYLPSWIVYQLNRLHFVVVVQLLRTKTMPFTKSFLQHRPISPIFESKFNRIELKKRYLAATFKIIDQMSKNCLVQKFPIQRITCESLESICSAVPSKRWSYTVKNFLSYPISRYDESDGKIKQNQCISFGVCLAMRTPQVKWMQIYISTCQN